MLKDINNYENKYQIDSSGFVISLNYNNTKEKKVLKHRINKKGRPYINLSKDGKYKSFEIHRLVAEHFIPNPDHKPQVNHINGIKDDNRIGNLEWVTFEENMKHASLNKLTALEFRNNKCILSNLQVLEIRNKYKPYVYTSKMLALEYGVSIIHIKNIVGFRKRTNM